MTPLLLVFVGLVSGGAHEEPLMRLLLVTLISWMRARWWKTTDGVPIIGALRFAVLIALFGVSHSS